MRFVKFEAAETYFAPDKVDEHKSLGVPAYVDPREVTAIVGLDEHFCELCVQRGSAIVVACSADEALKRIREAIDGPSEVQF